MKKIIFIISVMFISLHVMSSVPSGINYQAVIRDESGKILSNTEVNMNIQIVQGSLTGSTIFEETFTTSTSNTGIASFIIGQTNQTQFANINWANGPYFIITSYNIVGSSNFIELGSGQLVSVPYAMYADKAANVPTKISQLTNDASFATTSQLPLKISQLTNDKNFITANDINIPTKLSQLSNDQDFVSLSYVKANYVLKSQFNNTIDSINASKSNSQNILTSPSGKKFKMAVSDAGNISSVEVAVDADGNVYDIVTIGTKTWMKQNLKTTHFSNGDIIQESLDSTTLVNVTIAMRTHVNTSNYVEMYGQLYNYYAVVDSRNICPTGWHVATQNDYNDLIQTAKTLSGSTTDFAKVLKNVTGWTNNVNSTNSSGFTALPGGNYPMVNSSDPYVANRDGKWWTSNSDPTDNKQGIIYMITSNINTMYLWYVPKTQGNSVRCVKN